MERLSLCLILILLAGCTNADPSVTALDSFLKPSQSQTSTFVDTNVAGAKEISTSDQFVGRISIHSGTATKSAKTADNYQLTIRKVSF